MCPHTAKERETPQERLKERARGWADPPAANAPRKPFRILALDGGGVRGVFTAAILERLCNRRVNYESL